MAPRSRVLAFGSSGAVVLVGVACGVVLKGFSGELLAIALVTIGLGAALLLLFLEVGLSEDRERAREDEQRRERAARRTHPKRRIRQPHWPRRPL